MTLVCVQVLGPVRVTASDGADVQVGPPMQRCVLGLLALAAGQPVPVERLVDSLWGSAAPEGARRMVQWYVSRLRRVLEPEGIALCRDSGGYRLNRNDAQVDLHNFRTLAALPQDGADDVVTLRRALALWHGQPLAGLPGNEAVEALRAGLTEERLLVEERLYAVELAAGNHAGVLAALAASTRDHPLRERLVALRMRALCQAGRPAEALACYEGTRRLLASQLGVDPSAELRAEHLGILRTTRAGSRTDFPNLAADVGSISLGGVLESGTGPDSDALSARFQLPHRVSDFTGRATELAGLLAQAEPASASATAVTICAIDGMVGIGKTALAVQAAHAIADRFPDGQFYFELHAHTAGVEPISAVAALDFGLRSLGVADCRIPASLSERVALWRSCLANRRVLLVLDDAVDASQVRPLIPSGPGSLVLVTSRRRLLDLDGATPFSLDVLASTEAAELFTWIVGPRAAAESAATHDVVESCGYLPLAIRIAAARLSHRPQWTVAGLARLLADDPLTALATLGTAHRSLTGGFAMSYRQLDAQGRSVLQQLGLYSGADFDAAKAAALTGEPEIEPILEYLLDQHLLMQRAPNRYAFHPLIRLCAVACASKSALET